MPDESEIDDGGRPSRGEKRSSNSRRRRFLQSTGIVATAALAGCSGGGGGGGGSDDGGSGGGSGGGGSDGGGSDGGGSGTTTSQTGPATFTNEAGNEVGEDWETVQDLAQDEGTVNLYATLDRDVISRMNTTFNETYPEISIEHITGTSTDLASRFNSEYQADQAVADMFTEGGRAAQFWNNGWAMELSADYMPSFGEVPDTVKDTSNNYWIGFRLVLGNIHYNTDMVDEGAVQSWMDPVTDDRWSGGKLGWDPTPDQLLMWNLLDINGEEFFQELANQEPRWVDSHTDLARLCGAGEFPICFTYTHKMGAFADELPLNYFPLDPTPANIGPMFISNKAPNPNAALVYLNWLTSVEGQNALGEGEYIPMNPEAEYKGYPSVYPNDNYTVKTAVPTLDRVESAQEIFNQYLGEQTG
jgi:ABC-type Fe3+ transport system substrate-binding protein